MPLLLLPLSLPDASLAVLFRLLESPLQHFDSEARMVWVVPGEMTV